MKNTKLYLPIVLLLSGASMYAGEVIKEEAPIAAIEPAKDLNWEKQDNKWVSTETDQISTPLQLDKKLMSSIYVKEDITKKSLTLKDIEAKEAAIQKQKEETKKALEEQKTDYVRRITALKLAIDGQGVTIELNKKAIKQLEQSNEQGQKDLDKNLKELAERETFLKEINGEIKKEEPKKTSWFNWGTSKSETTKLVEAPKVDTKTPAKVEAPTVKATTPVAVLKKATVIKK